MTLDLLLADAVIVDGSGRDRFEGVVGIADGDVAVVEPDPDARPDAATTIDVGGDVVAPGFVDVLSYADLELFTASARSAKVRQGVTTELVGTNGYSMAPLWYSAEESHGWRLSDEDWRAFLSAAFGRADDAWDWGSVGDYLDAVADAAPATNVGTLVGHGTLRHNVTGLRDLPPSEDELEEMGDLLELGLMDGALGLSTSASLVEGTVEQETRMLLDRLAEYDRPLAVRDDGGEGESITGLFDAAAEVGVPVHIGDLASGGRSGRTAPLDRVREAVDSGLDPTGDVTPYETEVVMLASLLPRDAFGEGEAAFREALEDPAAREGIRSDLATAADWSTVRLAPPREDAGSTIADLAAARDDTVGDVLCDVLADDLKTTVTVPTASREALDAALADDRVTVATGGPLAASRTRRAHGTFAAFLGAGRKRAGIDLEAAVRKVTALPATVFGADGKARIEEGTDADIVVFDPDAIADRTTYEEPQAPPAGVEHVLVGGTFAVRDAELIGARAGEPIRRPLST